MVKHLHIQFLLCILALTTSSCACRVAPAPEHAYLVLTENPTTSITVQFQTGEAVPSAVDYGPAEPAQGAAWAAHAEGSARQVPGLPDNRFIHAVTLKGLQPGTRYFFRTSSGKSGSFHTLPGGDAPVRAIFGGDIGTSDAAESFLKVAAKQDPDLAVLGGDIAYCDGKLHYIDKWDTWLSRWEQHMRKKDGSMVPMVVAIGNHELNSSGSSDPAVVAPFYTAFFAQGGKSYFVRDIAPYARIVVLDSNYLSPEEEQAPHLREALESGNDKAFLLADYHVALFPTYNSYDQDHPTLGRKLWMPIFDEFHLSAAFEHHDHAFKRTKPIRGGEVAEGGTVYLGDGGMGEPAREIKNAGAWYLDKAEQRSHFWLVDFSPQQMHCQAVDVDGKVFDEVILQPRTSATVN